MEAIRIENLTYTYPDCDTPALSDINLTVKAGEFLLICGKSGSGKSTLLRQLKPVFSTGGQTQGTVYLGGTPISALTRKEQAEKIGFVFQNPDHQIVTDTVWHELAFGLESLGYEAQEIRARVSEMASFFGMENWFYKEVSSLSGGQKQLLSLASVLVMQPSVLLLDEPTAQLDPIAAASFLDTVRKINRELGITVILTEHRLEEAFPLADSILVMEAGRMVAKGAADRVGAKLYQEKHPMFFALPTPMRIYFAKENPHPCPVTIRQGRDWLSRMPLSPVTFTQDPPDENKETVLRAQDVWFRYEKNGRDILRGISLSLQKGECYALLGGNGAGKSTLLSVLCNLLHPYRGKVERKGSLTIGVLPQNPQVLFTQKTVEGELEELFSKKVQALPETREEIRAASEFCRISHILHRHPYDISGGEQQKVAMAKLLLRKPDILLLDEPTKGLDAHFKARLARMISALSQSGMTVLMVSHDIEFCAKVASRVGLLFDGIITTEGTPRTFFAGKNFYTTASSKMARGILQDAVLEADILSALSAPPIDAAAEPPEYKPPVPKEPETPKKATPHTFRYGLCFALLFFLVQFFLAGRYSPVADTVFRGISLLFAALSLLCLFPQKQRGALSQSPVIKQKTSLQTFAAWAVLLVCIPLTILFGVYILQDRKFYFISLFIILETLAAFAMAFEGHKPRTREIVLISVLCALAVSGRTAFYMFPHFKPMVALVILSGVCFGGETGFLVGAVTAFVSNFFFGQTPFTPWQMFALGIIGFAGGILFFRGFLRKTRGTLCVFGFFGTLLLYGGILNPASVLLGQANPTADMFLSAFALGFPTDLVHAFSTAFFLFFLSQPMIEKLERVKTKYGFRE